MTQQTPPEQDDTIAEKIVPRELDVLCGTYIHCFCCFPLLDRAQERSKSVSGARTVERVESIHGKTIVECSSAVARALATESRDKTTQGLQVQRQALAAATSRNCFLKERTNEWEASSLPEDRINSWLSTIKTSCHPKLLACDSFSTVHLQLKALYTKRSATTSTTHARSNSLLPKLVA